MARTFRGESIHKVDAKGRVSIPAAFRRVIEENDPDWVKGASPNLVIVYGDARWNRLEGYHMAAIADVDARIARLPRGSKKRRYLETLFNGQSHPTAVDDTGRLVLPQKLRDKIGITDEAYFIATGDSFQIWEPAAYAARAAEIESWFADEGDDFDPLMLLDSDDPEED